ncbi:ABC transporter permease subunit [Paracoccus sp. MBLB3053]|uniref:ABC transporter permease subunit n=1 Tax=Paracoccus aurantius TaxID=3073814 RepID=A0ABU2HVU2_9RHOB|nr:ABC transporter permease subunit [Paracoccus sp. MBLB3053]MDS9469177.1 ABC transporter permease subunit [Paracoccus sp. MBLB3053]
MTGMLGMVGEYGPILARGLTLTLAISGASICAAFLLGAVMGWLRHRLPATAIPLRVYIEAMRALPFLVVLLLVHFATQKYLFRAPAMLTGGVALALYGAAYVHEGLRAALAQIPRGQWEAAHALGLRSWQALFKVIAPQLARIFVPMARIVAIMLLKESAVLSVITVPEMTHAGLVVQAETFRTVPVFILLTAAYWLAALLISRCILAFEPTLPTSSPQQRSRTFALRNPR